MSVLGEETLSVPSTFARFNNLLSVLNLADGEVQEIRDLTSEMNEDSFRQGKRMGFQQVEQAFVDANPMVEVRLDVEGAAISGILAILQNIPDISKVRVANAVFMMLKDGMPSNPTVENFEALSETQGDGDEVGP